jgi:hypothetical protein
MDNNNNLPSTISGDGRKFISLLKNYLTDISDVVNDIYTVLGIDESTVLDIDEYIKNVKITEKKVGGNVTLEVSWNKDDIIQYAGVNILIKEKGEYYTGNWEETEVTRTYNTGKVTQFTLENISVGHSYQITVLGRNIKGATSKTDSSPAVEYYVSPNDHTPLLPYDFTVVFDKRGVYWSWKQRDNSETQWTELRLDENAGMEYNRLDITTGLYSTAVPSVRVGKAYLYNKGIGNAYTTPLTLDYAKPVPSAPHNVTVTPVFEGLTISFDAIPENCLGAKVYINNEQHQITTNHFTYLCSTGEYTIKACYIDVFGEGEMSQPINQSTVEEIPPDAVHVTDKTVFDDGVIVAKYIGDKAVVGTKIADGVITTDKLVANAITGDKIAANAITSDKIKTGEITAEKIATDTITGDKLAVNTITGDKIVAGTISGDKIAANSISGDKIQAGSIDADKIQAGVVDASKLNVSSLDAITANVGNLTGGTITGGTFRNENGSFSIDPNGNIIGAHMTGSRIDASNIYSGGQQLKNTFFMSTHVRSGERIVLPEGYSFDRCLVFVTNHWLHGDKAYENSGRYFSTEDMNRINNFNNTYSTYLNGRPSNGDMDNLLGVGWLHGEPNYTIYKRIFFMGSQAPFSGTFVFEDAGNIFNGFGITHEGYFFYFKNGGYTGYYGEADITIVAFW